MNGFEDPSEDPSNYKWGVFYFNPEDERVVVAKRIRMMGYTFNFARPESYLFLLLILAVVFISDKYRIN